MRTEFAGERGRSRFAEALGLTPSTYGNYEKGRTPPPELLVKVAELTGADLQWLLTGQERPERAGPSSAPAWAGNPRHRAVLERAAALLAERPGNLAALAAFLDLLEEKSLLERSRGLLETSAAAQSAAGSPHFGRWVPVFGRAAAGLARFWAELSGESPAADPDPAALDRMIAEAADATDPARHLAVLEPQADGRDLPVRLIQLPAPISELAVTEFLDAPALAERFEPLFGLRLAGDSMEPMFGDGTIVLCSPGEPARPGAPAVVRLAGQIGVSCKLYRPRGRLVRLVSANDRYDPQEFPAAQLEWALAVLASVRLD